MDEVQRLIMEVVNGDRIKELNQMLRDEQDTIRALKQELDAGKISNQQYEQSTQNVGRAMQSINKEMGELQRQSGTGGHSLMQLNYVLDDLINTSGGFERKLAAISNNIPGLVASIAGSGSSSLAGGIGIVSALLIALAPAAKAAWDAMAGEGGDKAEKVKEHLREIQEEIKRTHAEFQKLQNAPTDAEKTSAEGVKGFLEDRPKADMARQAVGASATNAEAHSMLTPEERDQLKAAQAASTRGDAAIAEEARRAAVEADIAAGGTGQVRPEDVERRRKELEQGRDRGRSTLNSLLNAGRQRFGEKVVTGATAAGPAGAEARRRLFGVAEATPGLTDLLGYSPDAIAAQEKDYEEVIEPAFQETEASGKAASRAGRKRRAARKQHDQFRARLQSQQTDAILQRHADEIRDEDKAEAQDQADADRALERDNNAWVRGKPAREKRERFDQARGLARQAAASQGFTRENGNAPNAQELDQMAAGILHNMGQGMSGNDAAMAALAQKLQQIQQAAMQFQQMQMNQQRLMMGGDNSGVFPMMPAGPF